jgi:hypothetical protein
MMKRLVLCVAVALLLSAPLPALARSIPDAPNEVDDPWFIDYVDNQIPTWYVGGQTGSFVANQEGSVPGYYYNPGNAQGDVGELRTIVDDYDGLWNPDYSTKEIDIFFYAHLDGTGYIDIRFDWWDDPCLPEPSNDPTDPCSPDPDGYSQWYRLTADDLGVFTVSPELILPDENPAAGVGWTPYSFHDIWDHQPRWVSIEIIGGAGDGITGGEALITGIDFEARCIPEPATVTLIGLGALALLLRRRR